METEDKSANALSNEQLLEYIKKQKAKIKKLEKDKEILSKVNVGQEQQIIAAATATAAAVATAAVSNQSTSSPSHSSSDNPSLFWGLIDRESSFKQKLAKNALNHLVATIEKTSLGKKYVPSRRSLFDQWKEHTYFMKMTAIATELLESSKSFLALEQKTVKLKALLARTHQSNQRFQEDTTSFKKIQKDAAEQLKSLKERDESEREALLETVRARTIETAFQYDMELAIQRAADGMTMVQLSATPFGNNTNSITTSKKCSALEEENTTLQVKLGDQEDSINQLKNELKSMRKIYEKNEKEFLISKENILFLTDKMSKLEGVLEEEERLKKDLEMELDLIMRGRGDMIKNMENNYTAKNMIEINLLKSELFMLKNNGGGSPTTNNQNNNNDNNGSNNSNTNSNNNSNSNNRNNNSGNGTDKLSSLNTEIEQLKAQITTLKNTQNNPKHNTFLNNYSASSSLSAGLIGTIPKMDLKPPKIGPKNNNNPGVNRISPRSPLTKQKSIKNMGNTDSSSSLSVSEVAGGERVGVLYRDPVPHATHPDKENTTTYICESLILKAANDFRLLILIPTQKSFRLTWEFSVSPPLSPAERIKERAIIRAIEKAEKENQKANEKMNEKSNNGMSNEDSYEGSSIEISSGIGNGKGRKSVEKADKSASSSPRSSSARRNLGSSSSLDIGFSVVEKAVNGCLPQIIPYSRVRGCCNDAITYRIDTGRRKLLTSSEGTEEKGVGGENGMENGSGKDSGSIKVIDDNFIKKNNNDNTNNSGNGNTNNNGNGNTNNNGNGNTNNNGNNINNDRNSNKSHDNYILTDLQLASRDSDVNKTPHLSGINSRNRSNDDAEEMEKTETEIINGGKSGIVKTDIIDKLEIIEQLNGQLNGELDGQFNEGDNVKKEKRPSFLRVDDDDIPDSFRSLIVLFDNSYSWYKAKEIKYSITVELLT